LIALGIDSSARGIEPVDYPSVFHQKLPLLFEAARNFLRSAAPNARSRYEKLLPAKSMVAR
jgi:hypothetical protein